MFVHILFLVSLFLLNMKKKTWRNLFVYWPSMFYVSFFNFFYYFLCSPYLLWDFKSKMISTNALRFIHIVLINPMLILLFLSNLPKKVGSQIIYFIKWFVFAFVCEISCKKFNLIYFTRGWHMGWSMILYIEMFWLSLLHTKRPSLTWSLSVLISFGMLLVFKVPIQKTIPHNFVRIRRYIQSHKKMILNTISFFMALYFVSRMLQRLRMQPKSFF